MNYLSSAVIVLGVACTTIHYYKSVYYTNQHRSGNYNKVGVTRMARLKARHNRLFWMWGSFSIFTIFATKVLPL